MEVFWYGSSYTIRMFFMFGSYRKVKANKGSTGVDGMGVEELSEYMEAHKEEISNGLLKGTYKPQPERRVYIPKPNGKKRPLGIPTVVDRVIQ